MATTAPESPSPPGATHPMAQTLALLQPWIDFVPQQQRRLGLFICLALAVHLAAFLFIRIDSTRAELHEPPRTHVTVENSRPATGAEESSAFLDSLSDPRLFLVPPTLVSLLAAQNTPIHLAEITSHLGTEEMPAPASAPDSPLVAPAAPSLQQRVIADMQPERQPFNYDEHPPATVTKTMWQWDPAFGSRHPLQVPELPSPITDTDLSPTELRVSVEAGGAVDHVLLEETCQKPEFDQLAILAAAKLRFPPVSEADPEWAHITVFWHCTAPPREVVEPTPPTPPGP